MKIRAHWPQRIRISDAWLFFLLLYMFQPSALSIGIVSKFYNLLKWMLPFLIAGTYIYKRRRPAKWIKLFFFMELWILLVTIYNKNYTAYAIKSLISITATACIVDIYADKFEHFLNVLLLHCELCVYINLLTLVIAPNGFISRENEAYGMSTEWFLGARNLFIIWFLPALLIAALYREKTKNNFGFFSLVTAIIVSIVIQGSGTTMVGVTVFLLLYFFPAIKKFLTPTNIAIVVTFLVVTIVINNSFEYLRPIVEDVLNKDMTMTNRLLIWQNAVSEIKSNLLFGHGYLMGSDAYNLLGVFPGYIRTTATHCHCHYLQVFFEGGLVSGLIYLLLCVKALYVCGTKRRDKIFQLILIALFCFLVISITEVYENALLYFILALPLKIGTNKMPHKNQKVVIGSLKLDANVF